MVVESRGKYVCDTIVVENCVHSAMCIVHVSRKHHFQLLLVIRMCAVQAINACSTLLLSLSFHVIDILNMLGTVAHTTPMGQCLV